MRQTQSSRKSDARVPRARRLRREVTDAERKIWLHLKRLSSGKSHFRRQATIGPYFADFACHELRLVIEIDGGQHNEPIRVAADVARTAYFNSYGYRVLRFWNNDVLNNVDGVLAAIQNALTVSASRPPTPDPSPPQAGGGEKNRSPQGGGG
jgi:very-short-patch-repair endonuclease